jgi:hypothetical protein
MGLRLGERVSVNMSLLITGICLFWWFYLAVFTLREVTGAERPISSLFALVIIPTILCVSIGIMIGITVADERALEEEEAMLMLHGKNASYGATRASNLWPRAVEEHV